MIGSGATHPARKAERREWLRALEEMDCFIDRGGTFPGSNAGVARKDKDIAVHAAAQFLDKRRVKRGVLPDQIQFTDDGAAGSVIIIFFGRKERRNGENHEGNSGSNREAHLWQS